jgi:hypothetical protein
MEIMYIYSLVSSPKLLIRSQWNLIFEVARKVVGRIRVSYRRDSEVGIGSRLRAGLSRNRVSISNRNRTFIFIRKYRPAVGPTIPFIIDLLGLFTGV